jgi:hypothetical protein
MATSPVRILSGVAGKPTSALVHILGTGRVGNGAGARAEIIGGSWVGWVPSTFGATSLAGGRGWPVSRSAVFGLTGPSSAARCAEGSGSDGLVRARKLVGRSVSRE